MAPHKFPCAGLSAESSTVVGRCVMGQLLQSPFQTSKILYMCKWCRFLLFLATALTSENLAKHSHFK